MGKYLSGSADFEWVLKKSEQSVGILLFYKLCKYKCIILRLKSSINTFNRFLIGSYYKLAGTYNTTWVGTWVGKAYFL